MPSIELKYGIRIVVDVIMLLLVAVPILLFYLIGAPFERGFYCDDDTIRYPYDDSSVSSLVLYLVGTFLPVVSMFVIEFVRSRRCRNVSPLKPRGTERQLCGRQVPAYAWALYGTIGTFLFGCACSQLLTDVAKYAVGRLRPHFLALCNPDWSKIDCETPGLYIQPECRTSDAFRLKEARLSFPSGHASFSAFTMVYLVLYLQSRLHVRIRLIRPTFQFGCLMIAFYTCLSRISDYKHHWSDVMFGSALGAAVAVFVWVYVSDFRESRLDARHEQPDWLPLEDAIANDSTQRPQQQRQQHDQQQQDIQQQDMQPQPQDLHQQQQEQQHQQQQQYHEREQFCLQKVQYGVENERQQHQYGTSNMCYLQSEQDHHQQQPQQQPPPPQQQQQQQPQQQQPSTSEKQLPVAQSLSPPQSLSSPHSLSPQSLSVSKSLPSRHSLSSLQHPLALTHPPSPQIVPPRQLPASLPPSPLSPTSPSPHSPSSQHKTHQQTAQQTQHMATQGGGLQRCDGTATNVTIPLQNKSTGSNSSNRRTDNSTNNCNNANSSNSNSRISNSKSIQNGNRNGSIRNNKSNNVISSFDNSGSNNSSSSTSRTMKRIVGPVLV